MNKIIKCNRQMTTYVWGDSDNPDSWECVRENGHKGQHKRYDY